MVRLLGLTRAFGDSSQSTSPREITSRRSTSHRGEIAGAGIGGDNGWLIRFFDSAFFCEWIAVSYLYKHEHSGVRDYLCNRMYTLPLPGIESYLFQICYMMVHKPSPSLDKFVIDICSKSIKIALKVHWFLLAELEDSDDNDGIGRIQDKCQIAATLMGEWPPLIRPPQPEHSGAGKSQVLNRILSSKQRLLSLTSSPPSSGGAGGGVLQEESGGGGVGGQSPEENKIFKKFIPGPKVRDALLFRKSGEKEKEKEKEEEEGEKEGGGFFKRLLRDNSKSGGEEEGVLGSSSKIRELFRKSSEREREEEDVGEKEGFFKRLLKGDDEEELGTSGANSEGFFKRLFRDSKSDGEERLVSKSVEEEEKEGFFKKLFKEKFDDKRDGNDKGYEDESEVVTSLEERRLSKSAEDDEKEGFFRKLFKDKFDDKRDGSIDKAGANANDEGSANGEEEESSEFSLFRRLFRVHPDDAKNNAEIENANSGSFFESSPGAENFFRKLFRDRDRSVEDSELFGLKNKEKNPGSPWLKDEKSNSKPPLPNNTASQFRKGAYHESLDFVLSLCETSYGLVDIFPVEDRKSSLRESLVEINQHVADAQKSGGVCFPMGKGVYRVLHIPEDEAVLLNSREKAPYMICVEVLKSENPSNPKDSSNSHKLSRGGIPLANGDALLPKPPPWAYPLWSVQEGYRNSNDRMSSSTAHAIDQAMTHASEAKVKFVTAKLLMEKQFHSNSSRSIQIVSRSSQGGDNDELEWVRVVLTADPSVMMDQIEDPGQHRRKEHRRVPSTVAIEEVKAAAAKGEAPPGLPLKGAGQDSRDEQPGINGAASSASDALTGELWEARKERIRKDSEYGKLPGWDLRSMIVKSGDDCRQEHLAVQLISHFYDIFQEAGLPLWLRPYEVLVTSSYTALIETIPDTASLHSIKSRHPNVASLRDFFVAKYKENSPSFKLAQRNFVESMAGYSLVCYLLQVKDRHNGNLLMDEEGHIIHIDFGFMLSNSPGGVNFESAPFKLTRELLEVMDSDAEGVPSEFFDYFKVLCIQGFLTCRKHAERVILLVEMLQDSGFPCFKGGPRTIQNLRKRFHLGLTEEHCVSLVLSLISSSLDAWRTRQYDYYQRVLNGIL